MTHNSLNRGLQNMMLEGTSILVTMKDYLTVLLQSFSPKVIGSSTLSSTLMGLPPISTKGVSTLFNIPKSTCNAIVAS